MNKKLIGQFSLAIISLLLVTGCGKSSKDIGGGQPNSNIQSFSPMSVDNPNKPEVNIGTFVNRKSVNGDSVSILGLTSLDKSSIEILEVKGPRGYETNFEKYVVSAETISKLSDRYDILSASDRSTLRRKMGSQIIVFNLYSEFCQTSREDSTVRVKYKVNGYVYQTEFEFYETSFGTTPGVRANIGFSFNINTTPTYQNMNSSFCDVRVSTR